MRKRHASQYAKFGSLPLSLVEEPQSFKVFFAKHDLSSFKFSTKVWERTMLVNTPILEAYLVFYVNAAIYSSNSLFPTNGIGR